MSLQLKQEAQEHEEMKQNLADTTPEIEGKAILEFEKP